MIKLMSHMVANYPDADGALAVAEGLVAGGSDYLEIQFPFSDPTADGPAIQAACQRALDSGFTVDAGFEFVRTVRQRFNVPVFIMSYASLVIARGVERFLQDGADAGATGFILPDLPPDYDEGVYDAAKRVGTLIMPVLVTTMNPDRLSLLEKRQVEFVYVALRQGITGRRTEIGTENIAFLDRLKGPRVMAGFGITEAAQTAALEGHVHAAIVGTALVSTATAVVAEHHGDSESLHQSLKTALKQRVEGLRSG